MAYFVRLSRRAERDLAMIFDYTSAAESDAALKRYEGLKQTILTLANYPLRCPITEENTRLRQLLYGNKPHIYRIIFRVSERKRFVDVLHILHGARSV
jgi:toxin ParE1/3/4